MSALSYTRGNAGDILSDFGRYWMDNFPGQDSPFPQLNGDPFYDQNPYYFKNEDELNEFLHDKDYEKSDDKKGMCFVIKIEENISG